MIRCDGGQFDYVQGRLRNLSGLFASTILFAYTCNSRKRDAIAHLILATKTDDDVLMWSKDLTAIKQMPKYTTLRCDMARA